MTAPADLAAEGLGRAAMTVTDKQEPRSRFFSSRDKDGSP
jgi:hypothetical protein